MTSDALKWRIEDANRKIDFLTQRMESEIEYLGKRLEVELNYLSRGLDRGFASLREAVRAEKASAGSR